MPSCKLIKTSLYECTRVCMVCFENVKKNSIDMYAKANQLRHTNGKCDASLLYRKNVESQEDRLDERVTNRYEMCGSARPC